MLIFFTRRTGDWSKHNNVIASGIPGGASSRQFVRNLIFNKFYIIASMVNEVTEQERSNVGIILCLIM
jgi:hypothetical protein